MNPREKTLYTHHHAVVTTATEYIVVLHHASGMVAIADRVMVGAARADEMRAEVVTGWRSFDVMDRLSGGGLWPRGEMVLVPTEEEARWRDAVVALLDQLAMLSDEDKRHVDITEAWRTGAVTVEPYESDAVFFARLHGMRRDANRAATNAIGAPTARREGCKDCTKALDGASDERCTACEALAHRVVPGGFVATLDGRAVRLPFSDSPYHFDTQHDAEHMLWICYPGLSARTRALPAIVWAGDDDAATTR